MNHRRAWVNDNNAALLIDLYELTMMQAYHREGMHGQAAFDVFFRKMPEHRNFLLVCGLDDVLHYLETFSFDNEAIEYLRSLDKFDDDFLNWLRDFRFEGDVHAVPEGTVVFAGEPVLEVVAPIPQAQVIETFVLNQITFQTVLASKAARVVEAARDRAVVDFGLRRMHGTDAGMKAARAQYIAGVNATSNVLAGQKYNIPVSGTMAHSYIEAHDDESAAFRSFASVYPETVLLVDTYDTLAGVQRVIELAQELGDGLQVSAIRLDSGDLVKLSKQARRMLDDAGLRTVSIFASGGLDEYVIADLVKQGAPIEGFGVGSKMGVSDDAPTIDSVYKIAQYAGEDRMKLSAEKSTLPGRKQVFRMHSGSSDMHDVIAGHDAQLHGRPLLRQVMRGGRRLDTANEDLQTIRQRAEQEIAALPDRLRSLTPADPPYDVRISKAMQQRRDELRRKLQEDRKQQTPATGRVE